MFNLQSTIIAAVVLAASSALGIWWMTSDYYQARFDAAQTRQAVETARVLQERTDEILRLQKMNQDLATTLEVNHAQNRQKLDQALSDNRRLARELGGLRDPYSLSAGCRALPSPAGATANADGQAATGRLSDQASEFLLEFARDADRAAEYAGLCYQWIQEIDKQKKQK